MFQEGNGEKETLAYGEADFMRDVLAEHETEVAHRERSFKEFKPQSKEAQERILQEIDTQRNAPEAKKIRRFLNNFPGCFPGGYRRKQSQMLRVLDGEATERQKRYEALYRDIDELLKNEGSIQGLEKGIGAQLSEEAIQKLISLYIAMRNKGYTHHELTS